MGKYRRWLAPTHWVYILVHLAAVLLGFLIYNRNTPLATAVGSSIIAAGITGWVVFIHAFLSQVTTERITILTEFGLTNCFEVRGVKIQGEYNKRLAHARKHIDIVGFGLRTLRQDYLSQFSQWKERANVRILLIDPDFPSTETSYAEQRDFEENNDPGTIRADVHKFIQDTRHLVGGVGGHSFEIRLYKHLPSVTIFRIDDELVWGPYLMKEQSRNTPVFIVQRSGLLFHRLVDHFECIWTDDTLSRPVPNEWMR